MNADWTQYVWSSSGLITIMVMSLVLFSLESLTVFFYSSVIAILTKSFVSDVKCLDQYNLAMCADRRAQRRLLVPLIFDELTGLPASMTSFQWFNCKCVFSLVFCLSLTEKSNLILWNFKTRQFFKAYMPAVRGVISCSFVWHKISSSNILRTIGPRITKFCLDIHTDQLYSYTGYNVTNYFQSEVIVKNCR